MRYAKQIELAVDKVDQALFTLRDMIKRGQNGDAIKFMESGPLKERFEELQNTITMSSTNTLGSRGTSQTGAL